MLQIYYNKLHENENTWTFKWYIIAIDSSTSDVRVFTFSYAQIFGANVEKVRNAIRDIVWHKTNNLWEHSRAYYEGNGVETLNL